MVTTFSQAIVPAFAKDLINAELKKYVASFFHQPIGDKEERGWEFSQLVLL